MNKVDVRKVHFTYFVTDLDSACPFDLSFLLEEGIRAKRGRVISFVMR